MTILLASLAGMSAGALGLAGGKRLRLSRAKHRSLAGHVRLAKRIAGQIPFYSYGRERFFRADGAPEEVAAQREAAFERLSGLYTERFARTLALTRECREGLSDLQFTGAYRVPFPFSADVRERLGTGASWHGRVGPSSRISTATN